MPSEFLNSPEADTVTSGRAPGGEEVGSEGNYNLGAGQVEVRHQVLLEYILQSRSVGNVVHGLKCQVRAADGFGEPGNQHPHVTTHGPGHDSYPARGGLNSGPQGVQGGIPIYRLVLARTTGTGAAHGTGYTVGVVGGLERGFATRALLSQVGGVEGVALDLLRPPFHHPDDDPFARRASAAKAGVPVVLASDQILREFRRTLEAELTLADAKAFAGHRAHRGEASPS